jgi:cation diffusion facilitator family transporter
MSCDDCHIEIRDEKQRRVLWVLLAINAAMFFAELMLGIVADSSGLIADSLDMFADALVYGLSLYAVGRAASQKTRAARLSGLFQVALALGMAADVVRRIVFGSEPVSALMIGVGAVALVANVVCLMLISKHRDGGVHMRASWIFSTNDVLANLGVIAAGVLVWATRLRWFDYAIGLVIFALVLRGGFAILREAREEEAGNRTPSGA